LCAKKCAKTLQGRKGHGVDEIYNINHPTKEGSIPRLQPSTQPRFWCSMLGVLDSAGPTNSGQGYTWPLVGTAFDYAMRYFIALQKLALGQYHKL
jgi:hypothetical protein